MDVSYERHANLLNHPTKSQYLPSHQTSFLSSPIFRLQGPQGRSFYVHGGLLAARSKGLSVHVNGDMLEAKTKQIVIQDVDGDIDDDTVMRFVEYAYKGDYTVPDPDVVLAADDIGIYPAASVDKMQSQEMRAECPGMAAEEEPGETVRVPLGAVTNPDWWQLEPAQAPKLSPRTLDLMSQRPFSVSKPFLPPRLFEPLEPSSASRPPYQARNAFRTSVHAQEQKGDTRRYTSNSTLLGQAFGQKLDVPDQPQKTDTWCTTPIPTEAVNSSTLTSKRDQLWNNFCSQALIRSAPKWQPRPRQDMAEDFSNVFLSHVQLYIFSNRWDCADLRSLVLQKLRLTLCKYEMATARMPEIVELVRHTYAHTHGYKAGGIDTLRDLVVDFVGCRIKVLGRHEQFQELLDDCTGFGKDLLRKIMCRIE